MDGPSRPHSLWTSPPAPSGSLGPCPESRSVPGGNAPSEQKLEDTREEAGLHVSIDGPLSQDLDPRVGNRARSHGVVRIDILWPNDAAELDRLGVGIHLHVPVAAQ